eukprot:s506_g16.t1
MRLDRVRDECARVQTKLQNEHLAISSQLHKCQVELEQHLQESQDGHRFELFRRRDELEGRLNRALEEKELKESQVGVISMAIEQLFSRTVNSCRLPQRKKARPCDAGPGLSHFYPDATDVKFAPVRGDKSDVRLEEMFKQIIERVEDLQEMHSTVQLGREKPKEEEALFDERGFMERVKFLYQRSEDDVRRRGTNSDENPESLTLGLGAGSSTLKGRPTDPNLSGGHSGRQLNAGKLPVSGVGLGASGCCRGPASVSGRLQQVVMEGNFRPSKDDGPSAVLTVNEGHRRMDVADSFERALRKENERTQLLWKALIQGLSLTQAAELFREQDHEPPSEQELMDLRTNTLAHVRKKTMGHRQMMKSALKNKNKNATKRFLNNELVSVTKKDKYYRTGGESAEDKAKTSVELYIIGIGRGGRHAVKLAMHDKKKGPVSNKHNK